MALPLAGIEGKYEILAKLSEGGMGAIYQVRHRLLDEVRVVKVLRPQHEGDEELRARFAREARAAIKLRHPNTVQIFDFSVDDRGAGLIVMEHIHGVDLQRLIESGHRPSLPLALEIARQSLRALGFLHRAGYVHRDVSPDNLMLALDVDRDPLVKLIDLGIAKRVDSKQQLTVSGSFLGKFRFASPEHFGGDGGTGVDARSDLYTFALVFYQLLTGVYPVPGDSTSQLIAAHLFQPPVPFDQSDPSGRVPDPLRAMLLRALQKSPDDRFPDASTWVREIQALQREVPLDDDGREEARRLVERAPRAAQVQTPSGSTQRRLDRHFGLDATPRPGTLAEAAEQAMRLPRHDPSAALLAGADALYQLGQLGPARQQVETLLRLDPENAQARELLAKIEAGPSADAVAPEDSTLGGSISEDDTLAAVDAHSADAAFEPQSLEPEMPELPSTVDLLDAPEIGLDETAEIELAAPDRSDNDANERAVDESTLETIDLSAAVSNVAGAAVDDEPSVEAADDEADDWGDASRHVPPPPPVPSIESPTAEAPSVEAPSIEALAPVERALERGRLVEADRLLFQLREGYGPSSRLAELEHRLAIEHQRGLERQIRAHLEQADRRVEAGEYPTALELLRKAQAMAPAEGALRDELAEGIMRLHRTVKTRERQRAVDEIERHVLRLLDEGALDEARTQVRRAREAYGAHETFQSLDALITQARDEQLAALVNEAGLALEAHRFKTAIRFLEQVLVLDPTNSWVQSQLDRARESYGSQRSDLRAVDEALGRRDLSTAARALDDATERWGEAAIARARDRFDRARREQTRLLLAQAEAAQADDDLVKAKLLAMHAKELAPEDTAVHHFTLLLDSAVDQEHPDAAPVAPDGGMLHTIAEIEKLRIEGEPLRAWKATQQAIERFGEVDTLVDLRRQLAESILDETSS